jgi:hypothetical protein
VSDPSAPGDGCRTGAHEPEGWRLDGDEVIGVANEFAEVVVRRVLTRNGARLMIHAPRAGRSIALCPVELEALTWQTPEVFSAMLATPAEPLGVDEE